MGKIIRRGFQKHPAAWAVFYFMWVLSLFIILGSLNPRSLAAGVILRFALGAGILYGLYKVFRWTPKALGFSTKGLFTALRLYWIEWLKMVAFLSVLIVSLHPQYAQVLHISTPPATLAKIARNLRQMTDAKKMAVCAFSLSVGFYEEIFMRVGMVSQLRLAFPDSPRSAWRIALISGALFASLHWINLGAQSLSLTAMQVIQAFGTGVLWGAIYWRSGNMVVPIVGHTLNDVLILLAIAGSSPAVSASFQSTLTVMAVDLFLTAVYLRPKKAVSSGIQTPLCYNKK